MLNTHAALKIFDLLLCAEMAKQWAGTEYSDFLKRHRIRYAGQARREIDHMLRLTNLEKFIHTFLSEV